MDKKIVYTYHNARASAQSLLLVRATSRELLNLDSSTCLDFYLADESYTISSFDVCATEKASFFHLPFQELRNTQIYLWIKRQRKFNLF